MEPTSQLASQAAQVVPFHCIICFDSFNLTDKTPVILPCGHTYLCEPCSKRIKTCMECRTPLFWTPPPRTAAITPLTPYRNNARYSRYSPPAPPSPVKAPEPIPLPVPKNVVLLAMLEAAERQIMMAASVMDISQDDIEDDASGQVDEDGAERQRIIAGMESLAGPCGTYAVREEEGLAVLPHDPRVRHHEQVRDPTESRDPFVIEKGQTVQVVVVDNGVAQLARGMGYIVAGESQLVKVGGPLDISCQLEGTLDLVEHRKRELQRQLQQVERLSKSLKADIEGLEGLEPTHPIITLPPPAEPQEQASPSKPPSCPGTPDLMSENRLDTPILSQSPTTVTHAYDGVELSHSPATRGRSPSSPTEIVSPFSIDNADINGRFARAEGGVMALYQKMDDNDPPGIVEFGCSSFLFGRICSSEEDDDGVRRLIGLSFDDSESSDGVHAPPSIMPSVTASPSMVAGSAQRPPVSPHRTPSFDTIDFRTGMSGHRALGSTRAADPRAVPHSRGRIRMMSEHMGIGRIRGPPAHPKSTPTRSTPTKGIA